MCEGNKSHFLEISLCQHTLHNCTNSVGQPCNEDDDLTAKYDDLLTVIKVAINCNWQMLLMKCSIAHYSIMIKKMIWKNKM